MDEDDDFYGSDSDAAGEGSADNCEGVGANDNMDMPAAGGGAGAVTASSGHDPVPLARTTSYRPLQWNDLVLAEQQQCDNMASVLFVSAGESSILLRFFQFNETALQEAWFEDDDKVREMCGLPPSSSPPPTTPTPPTFECQVCFDDAVPWKDGLALGCHHRFCNTCWGFHLKASVDGGPGAALLARCQYPKCPLVVPREAWVRCASPESREAYDKFRIRSYVEDNALLLWCPNPKGCPDNGAISYRIGAGMREVSCTCGFTFCWACQVSIHYPATCSERAQWGERDKGDENLNNKFYLEQTKPCPKCGVRTNKDGGCMYMTCTRCKTNWCWQCGLGDHHVYECNRPPREMNEPGADDMTRYLFYFERFFNHRTSLGHAEKTIAAAKERIAALEAAASASASVTQFEFLMEAVDMVVRCRTVLSWTYVRAFYMTDRPARERFEFTQGMLESYTEKLTALTEKEEELERMQAKPEEFSLDVRNHTRAVHKFLDSIEADSDAADLGSQRSR